jgi:hypothetical protein
MQCEATPREQLDEPRLWLTSGSPLTTAVVQLAIWEWVFVWISMAMIIITLLHNGFIVGPRVQDSFFRVSLVLAYLAAYVVHANFVWQSCITFFTNVAVGAAWSLLSRASFSVIDTAQLDLQMIEKSSDAFGSALSAASDQLLDAEFKAAMDTIHEMQTSERAKATIAADCALERIIASGMLLLFINISSGFLVWSTTTADEALGSLGLLSFLSLGIAAMYTSAVQLSILNSSYEQIVYMKEIMINGQAVNFVKKRPTLRQVIGFTKMSKTAKSRRVSVWDFVGETSSRDTNFRDVLCLLLFGPAYLLLPTHEDRERTANRAKFQLSMMVRGHPVVLTTANTDAHAMNDDGGSWEAINVCYQPSYHKT